MRGGSLLLSQELLRFISQAAGFLEDILGRSGALVLDQSNALSFHRWSGLHRSPLS